MGKGSREESGDPGCNDQMIFFVKGTEGPKLSLRGAGGDEVISPLTVLSDEIASLRSQ
jgi:hypothetical protein